MKHSSKHSSQCRLRTALVLALLAVTAAHASEYRIEIKDKSGVRQFTRNLVPSDGRNGSLRATENPLQGLEGACTWIDKLFAFRETDSSISLDLQWNAVQVVDAEAERCTSTFSSLKKTVVIRPGEHKTFVVDGSQIDIDRK